MALRTLHELFSRLLESQPLLFLLRILVCQFKSHVCVCVVLLLLAADAVTTTVESKKIEFVRAPHTILMLSSIIWLASCILCVFVYDSLFVLTTMSLVFRVFQSSFLLSFGCYARARKKKYEIKCLVSTTMKRFSESYAWLHI